MACTDNGAQYELTSGRSESAARLLEMMRAGNGTGNAREPRALLNKFHVPGDN